MCSCHSILECCVAFSGVELSIRSFVLYHSKFNGENIATNCFMVTILDLDCFTKKHFGHYALLKIFSLRSPRR